MRVLILLSLILGSCSRLSLAEYASYKTANSSDYAVDTLIGHTSYILNYVPLEDIVAANATTLDGKELKAEYAKMKSAQFSSFQFNMISTVVARDQQKKLQTEYFSFHLKKDIKAVTIQGDTLECRHFLCSQNGSLGNKYVFEMDFQSGIANLSHILFSIEFPEKAAFRMDLKHFQKKYPSLKI